MEEISKEEKKSLSGLLSGETKTDSQYINYSLGQIREKAALMKIMLDKRDDAMKAVSSLQKELISLDAEIAAREIDIFAFLEIESTDKQG